ncbi:MAG: hypothetical protein KGO05_10340, partial [Chloroflexota bacterium]|nr:hypothetical protein [Chloroflexota bacterium]
RMAITALSLFSANLLLAVVLIAMNFWPQLLAPASQTAPPAATVTATTVSMPNAPMYSTPRVSPVAATPTPTHPAATPHAGASAPTPTHTPARPTPTATVSAPVSSPTPTPTFSSTSG